MAGMIHPEGSGAIIAPIQQDVLKELSRSGVKGEHAKPPRGLQRQLAREHRHHITQEVRHGGHDAQLATATRTHRVHERGNLGRSTIVFEGSAKSLPDQRDSRPGYFQSVARALHSVDVNKTGEVTQVASQALTEITSKSGSEAFTKALGSLSEKELTGVTKLSPAALEQIGVDKLVSYVKNHAPKGTVAALKTSLGQAVELVGSGDPSDREKAQQILTDLFDRATKTNPDVAWPLALSAVGLGSAAFVLKRGGKAVTAAKLALVELALLLQGCASNVAPTLETLPPPQVGITQGGPSGSAQPTETTVPTAVPSEIPVMPTVIPPEVNPQPVETAIPQPNPTPPDYRSARMFTRAGYEKGWTVKELQAMVDGTAALPTGWTAATAAQFLQNVQENYIPLFQQIGTDISQTRVFTNETLDRNTVIGYKNVGGRWYMTCAVSGGVASYRCDSRSAGWFDTPPTETPIYTLLGLSVDANPTNQVVKFVNGEYPVYATLDASDAVANVLALGPNYEFISRDVLPKAGDTKEVNGVTYTYREVQFGPDTEDVVLDWFRRGTVDPSGILIFDNREFEAPKSFASMYVYFVEYPQQLQNMVFVDHPDPSKTHNTLTEKNFSFTGIFFNHLAKRLRIPRTEFFSFYQKLEQGNIDVQFTNPDSNTYTWRPGPTRGYTFYAIDWEQADPALYPEFQETHYPLEDKTIAYRWAVTADKNGNLIGIGALPNNIKPTNEQITRLVLAPLAEVVEHEKIEASSSNNYYFDDKVRDLFFYATTDQFGSPHFVIVRR